MLEFHKDIFAIQWITFVLGMAAIWAMYLKPLGKHLRARREGIVKDLAAAESARSEADKLRLELKLERERMVDEARRQMDKIKVEAEAFRLDLMKKAREEQEALLKSGRRQLEQERLEAVRKIREQTAQLVVEATAKLLEKNLNKATQVSLAQKFVRSIKVSRN